MRSAALLLVSVLVLLTGCVATAPDAPQPSWTTRGHTPAPPAVASTPAAAPTEPPAALPAGADGLAMAYAPSLHGTRTASGEAYDRDDLTAAHGTYGFGTRLKVVNPANGRSAIVRVNDAGPFAEGVVLMVSEAAAMQLGMPVAGKSPVALAVLEAPAMTPPPVATAPTPPASSGLPDYEASGLPAYDDVPAYTGATPAPSRPTSPSTSSPSLSGTFAVQLGAFADEAGARALANSLPGATVEPMSDSGQRLYHVLYGSYAQRSQADSVLADLKSRGYEGFIRKPQS